MLTCEHKYVCNKLNSSNIIFRPNFTWMIVFCPSNFSSCLDGYGRFFNLFSGIKGILVSGLFGPSAV